MKDQFVPVRQTVGRYFGGTVLVSRHFHLMLPAVAVPIGENDRLSVSMAAFARCGVADENVAVITPPNTATWLTYLPWIEPAEARPAEALSVGYVPLLLKNSATEVFARLFLLPGVGHCRGGTGPDTFDGLGPLVEWVEHGIPPERLIAAKLVDGAVTRTRPL